MTTSPHADLAQSLLRAAQKAGQTILDIYQTDFTVDAKDDQSPVTEADQRAEDIILEDLQRIAPQVPVLAEEAAAAGKIPDLGATFFLVDPLDGTREFVSRNGEFTVNIALIENGCPVAGVVFAPAIGRLFLAHGKGNCFEYSTPVKSIASIHRCDPHRLMTRPPGPDGLKIVASRSHRDRETEDFIRKFKVKEIVSAGSSLKFCLIAAGQADFYPRFGRTMEWDTAAGQAVLEAAGGVVTDLKGRVLTYGKEARGFDNPAFLAWGRSPEGVAAK
ncbi:MAG: 3'(2'),5'-bisphosphate nucleotidase CysQ [Fimbriimonadaceae bacterium]|nr:3'(2'),5'-bisphosphate nucleotidase CysQ [Alphaproteobacteria bacterium]